MQNSYQHSLPTTVTIDTSPVDDNFQSSHHHRRRLSTFSWKLALILGSTIGVLVVLFHGTNHTSYTYLTAEVDGGPPKETTEGEYKWKKCMNSEYPDCWKKEDKRAGNYWENFHSQIKSSWNSFEDQMESTWSGIFGGNSTANTTTTKSTEKKEDSTNVTKSTKVPVVENDVAVPPPTAATVVVSDYPTVASPPPLTSTTTTTSTESPTIIRVTKNTMTPTMGQNEVPVHKKTTNKKRHRPVTTSDSTTSV